MKAGVYVERSTLSDKAYYMIKDMIPACEKGQYLSMRDIATQIGMSYTPVREAFQRLKGEGLLDLAPNVGFFVPRLDMKDLMQIFQVRECIEGFVFERAFDLLTREDIIELKDSVERQRKFLNKGEIREYLRTDEQFHLVFLRTYNNPHLTTLVNEVRDKYLVCSKRIREGSSEAIEEHKRIIEFIEAGQKEEGAKLLEAHIVAAKQRMMEGYISFIE
jgi:DNA-binding GntR family transcriptional regulator